MAALLRNQFDTPVRMDLRKDRCLRTAVRTPQAALGIAAVHTAPDMKGMMARIEWYTSARTAGRMAAWSLGTLGHTVARTAVRMDPGRLARSPGTEADRPARRAARMVAHMARRTAELVPRTAACNSVHTTGSVRTGARSMEARTPSSVARTQGQRSLDCTHHRGAEATRSRAARSPPRQSARTD